MLIKEASIKWNISERRIRKLIEEGRIEGATKISNIWNIPDDVAKPIDRRVKRENNKWVASCCVTHKKTDWRNEYKEQITVKKM